MTVQARRGCGQTRMAGAYTDQRLNLSKLWEGPRKKCQGFKPDPGNPAVRDYRGASGNVSHGGNVHPSCNRKSGKRKPPPTAGRARFLSQSVRADFTQRSEIAFARGALKGVRTCSMPRCCKAALERRAIPAVAIVNQKTWRPSVPGAAFDQL